MYLYAGYSTEVSGVTLSGSVGMNKFDSNAMMTKALGTTGLLTTAIWTTKLLPPRR